MKLCLGHYVYKSIPDAKFESCSSSSFGDVVTKFTSEVIKLGYLPSEQGFKS